ncbi:MAG: DUF2723 domain-containing protein [Bacteroidetes bacterium]|nr:MAG: DUF2723 domain-containing protein [Bacteroidota bacterium]
MMNYKKINTYLGWLSFLIAFVVYAMTAERTASFWDCGEFISASAKLQVVHPPGAPLFLLLGNFFSHLAGSPDTVAFMVNMLSVITSALCVMFTFWTITHFAQKLVDPERTESKEKNLLIYFAGLVGALTLTFTDTFWFSAVEAEVYASSSFFTALTFWCILKWEHAWKEKDANRWIILIAYLIGLAIGVHLLNLLVIPAIVYVVYFKFKSFDMKGFLASSIIGAVILAVVQVGIIPGIPTLAMKLDIAMVNGMKMPFGSGVWVTALIILAIIGFGLWYSHAKKNQLVHIATLSFTFILIGYSSYAMVVIRSLAEPTIDMNNPENPINLVSYLNREQYGDRPLVKGPYFNAKAISAEAGKQDYRKGDKNYEKAGFPQPELTWDPKYVTLFPRMGDQQKSSSPAGYANWAGVDEKKVPTMGQNLKFFFKYQLNHMYWRYFLWNFAGRQDDIQGDGDVLHGNYLTGIPFFDNSHLGPQAELPEHWKNNKARNTYFLLPLIIGLMGFALQYIRNKSDFLVVAMLFLFTGILIAVYLNAPPYEPRERDYTLVGSFQIFCIWIGLGVIFLAQLLEKYLGKTKSAWAAFALAMLASPVLLAQQNWDDHDRSERTMVVEFARDYLMSCDSNAILFTNGDNDTYPLWFVQNVENYRTDVRIINLNLLNFDWYVESLTRKVMDSEPFKLSVTKDKYAKGLREQLLVYNNPKVGLDQNRYYDFGQIMKFITTENDSRATINMSMYYGPEYSAYNVNYFPVRNIEIDVNKDIAAANGTLRPEEMPYAVDKIRFSIPGTSVLKADWVLLDLIMNNKFERPVYFASNSISNNHLGLGAYMRLDGLVYRLIPATLPADQEIPLRLNKDIMYSNLVDQFELGNMKTQTVLGDETTYRMIRTLRTYFGYLALKLSRDGEKERLEKAINRCMEEMPASVVPYDEFTIMAPLASAAYTQKLNELGDKLCKEFADEQLDLLEYCLSFSGRQERHVSMLEKKTTEQLGQLLGMLNQYQRAELVKEIELKMNSYGR